MIYLATPYTNYPKGTHEAFVDACEGAARFLRAGIPTFSPIAHSHPIAMHGRLDPFVLNTWLPINHYAFDACEALLVYKLEGWAESEGVAAEIRQFDLDKKPIYFFDPENDILDKFLEDTGLGDFYTQANIKRKFTVIG